MKILMLSDNYPPEMNANARIFSELAEEIVKKGADVSIITSHPNFPQGKLFPGHTNKWRNKAKRNGVDIIRVKTYIHPNKGFIRRSLDFISFGIASFFWGLFERRNDFIIGVTPQFFCAVSACILALVKRKPFILILCDLWPDSIVANELMSKGLIYRFIKKIELFLYKKAKIIAILSPCFRNYLNQLNIEKAKIIDFISAPNKDFYPRERNQYLLEKYALSGKFVVGYIGTFGISHNHEDILKVFKLFEATKIHLLMVGDGAKADYLNALKIEYKLKNVTIVPPVTATEVPDYWSLCDVAIIPLALTETNKTVIPSKILEAMRMGLPIILYTPKGEATQFFEKSEAVWHVMTGDTEKLSNVINQLSQTDNLEKKENAIKFSKAFSREKQAQILLDHIRTIL